MRVELKPPSFYLDTMIITKYLKYLLFFCFTFTLFSCEKDEEIQDRIVGAWELTSETVNGEDQDLTGKNQILLFAQTYVFKRYLVEEEKYRIGGWSIKGGQLNISLDLPAAYYIETLTQIELVTKRIDFNDQGEIQSTLNTYKRVSEALLP